MEKTRTNDARQAIAERNIEAILDGAERLLQRREQPSISAIAAEAGVSRPTVYAHFEDRTKLIEALVERAVRQLMAAVESAEPDRGPAPEALERLIGASWEHLGHNQEVAGAAAAELSSDAMRRAHGAARAVIRRLVERGRREGAFRTDVPSDWLVTASLALVHAMAEQARARELDSGGALKVLSMTIGELLRGQPEQDQPRNAP